MCLAWLCRLLALWPSPFGVSMSLFVKGDESGVAHRVAERTEWGNPRDV